MRILANGLHDFLGKQVTVEGWVNSRRDHGGLIFIDLRDHTGIIQLVVTPETEKSFKLAETVRDEFVLKATGTMREREPDLVNPNIPTGKIELVVEDLELLNKSEPLPVNTHDDGEKSSEERTAEKSPKSATIFSFSVLKAKSSGSESSSKSSSGSMLPETV